MATHYLAANLRSLGLKIIPTKDAFEIAGISEDFNDKFSRRTKTIEAEAIKRGITDPAQKAKLAVLTRERKVKGLHISEIEPYWWGNLLPEERRALEGIAAVLKRSRASELSLQMVAEPAAGRTQAAGELTASRLSLGQKDAAWAERHRGVKAGGRVSMNKATAPSFLSTRYAFETNDDDRKAVALGLEHVFERKSVVSEDQLVAEALKTFCVGKASVAGVRNVVAQAPLIRRERNGEMYVTTAEVLAEEDRIADQCLFGKGRFEAMNSFWRIRDEELNPEQKNAVFHVLNSQDFITGIAGNPGVGKTRVLQEIKRGVEGGYGKLLALAPWGVTAHDVLRKAGFENAETVAKLLTSEKLQVEARGAVLLVDEAGLLSAREADRLITLAQELKARLVFAGDVGQHHAVERGQAFDHLRKAGRMEVAEVTQIQRQKGNYKRVVELVLQGKTEEAIELMQKMGGVYEMTREERKTALAKDYVAAIEKGETALVVAPTHAECNDVTEGIRTALKGKGLIKPADQSIVMGEQIWTGDQKSDPKQYKRGLLVEINNPVKGFSLGEKLEVIGVRDDMVRVRGTGPAASKSKLLPLAAPEAFSVYEPVVKDGCQWEVLPNLSWTDAQKSDPDQYKPGLVVQVNGHVKGFALGERLEVIGKSGGMVRVRSDDGFHTKIKALPLGAPDTFSVHERDTIEICEGDLLRITANCRSEDRRVLRNGSIHAVDYISHDGKIVLDNGCRLNRDSKHLAYGYTLTSHAAQGKTVDRVFLAQSAELSYGAIDLTEFLVSISRGSKGLKMYTDDLELLRENVSQVRERLMATELVHGQSEEKAPEKSRGMTSAQLGRLETGKGPERELTISERLGKERKLAAKARARARNTEAKVTRKAPAREQEIEIVPQSALERKREQEIGMVMGM